MEREDIDALVSLMEGDEDTEVLTNREIDTVKVPFLAVCSFGICIVIKDGTAENADFLIPRLHLPERNVFFWFSGKDGDLFYDTESGKTFSVQDIACSIANVWNSTRCTGRASSDEALKDYSEDYTDENPEAVLSDTQKERILSSVPEPKSTVSRILGEKYRTVNGKTYIKKTGLVGDVHYYPITEDLDADEHYRKCLFGGIIGLHKYAEHRFLQGIFYTLTLGFLGVFWISDLITMMGGNYRLKNGEYLGKVTNDKGTILTTLIAAAIGILVVIAVWFAVGTAFEKFLPGMSQSAAEKMLQYYQNSY